MSDTPPPPPDETPMKKGGSPLVYIGIGCGALALLAIAGFVVTLQWGFRKGKAGLEQLKATAAEFEKNPARSAAEMTVKWNPDLDLIHSDEAAGTITFRKKSTGETGTISYKDAEEGKFSFELGKTAFKIGEPVPLPAWMPALSGLVTAAGSVRTVSGGRENIKLMATIDQPVETVAAFYGKGLAEAGFTLTSQQQTAGVFATHMLQARDDAGKRTVTISITQEKKDAPASVVLAGEWPTAEP